MTTDPTRWRRLRAIFDELVEIPPAEQTGRLAALTDGDEALRVDVKSLLAAAQAAGDRFEQPLMPPASWPDDRPDPSLDGTRIGSYRVTREIGRGGMGAVYEAFRDDAAFTKRVAIKMVPNHLVAEPILRRFRQERQILARLEHKNIAVLLDGGVTDDGRPYFAMEYVEGERIDHYCDRHQLGTRARLQLIRQVCAAVQYAHQHLVIHRDLKPSNVLVGPDGTVKLLDFGIAKLIEPTSPEDCLTETGTLPLTTSYASPEQFAGTTVGTATDIYSLGVLIYELLAGRPPFLLGNLPVVEIRRRVMEETPLAPSLVRTTESLVTAELTRTMVGELDHIVLMALRKEPARRYPSAEQLSEDLLRLLAGQPVRAEPDSYRYRASKFVVRNRAAVAAMVVIFVTLLSGLVVTLWQLRIGERERAKSEVVNRFLQGVLLTAGKDPKSVRGDSGPPTMSEALDAATQRLQDEELKSNPEIKATLQQIVGSSYLSLGQYQQGEKNLREALAAQTALFGDDNLETVKTLLALAQLSLIKADYVEAERFFRRRLAALRTEEGRGRIPAATLMSALSDFALVRRARGDSKEAEALLREAMTLGPRLRSNERGLIGQTETILVLALLDHGKFSEAEINARRLVAEFRQQGKTDSPEMCSGLTILGSVLMEEGNLPEAEANLAQAESLYRRLFDANYQAIYDNVRLQAQLNYLQGRLGEAATRIEQVLNQYRSHSSPKYISFATALTVKGLILNASGKTAEAERVLREAVQVRTENLPQTHFMSALTNGALGEVLTGQQRFAEAEPLLLSSYNALRQSQAADNPRTVLARRRLVDLYQGWSRPDQLAKFRSEALKPPE